MQPWALSSTLSACLLPLHGSPVQRRPCPLSCRGLYPASPDFCLPCPLPACHRSDDETALEKAAAAWGKKNRPKGKKGGPGGKAGGGGDFQPKQNVRKNKGRKR